VTTSDEWYTPAKIISAARQVMGDIDTDPASCELAQEIVKAHRYYTIADNGLFNPWYGRVWLNPPYSSKCVVQFTSKFTDEYLSGNMTEGIVLVNNYADTRWFHRLLNRFPVCFTLNRLEFWAPDKSPHRNRWGQAFFYAGNNKQKFASVFSQFGTVVSRIETLDHSLSIA
jgi:ParB family chromosome partitioning protein